MDKLDEIMAWKRKEIAPKVRPVSERELTQLGERQRGKKTFHEALAKPEELSVIAEIKRKSPSAGTIAENVSAVDQARIYENAGVDAMSILTDDKFFGGRMEDLWEVNELLSQHQRATPTIIDEADVPPYEFVSDEIIKIG